MPKSNAATGARETKAQILDRTEREGVKFMRLQFTDILGAIKNVEIPGGQFEEALDELEKDDLVRETLGGHLFEHFVAAKREEWLDYIKHVSPWEVDRYLGVY